MIKVRKALLNNLKILVDSDFSCVIEFNQNNFRLVEISSNVKNVSKVETIVNNVKYLDFSNIQKDFKDTYNVNSVILDTFTFSNYQYYIYSSSTKSDHFDEEKIKIQNEMSDTIKELIQINNLNVNNLVKEEDYFQLFANVSGEFVFTLDQQGVITFINKYGLNQLKYSYEEIIGKHFFDLIKENHKTNAAESFQKIITEKSAVEFEVELMPKVNFEQLFNINLVPVFSNGKIKQLFGVGSNISLKKNEKERIKELLAKLTEAKRINDIERDRARQEISVLNELNNLKNEFISNVSHELRTPLASIIGFSETITDDKNLTLEAAKEFSNVILTESKRLAKLINDVLDFSELESEKLHLNKNSIDIISILNECTQNIKEECKNKKITLTCEVPDSKIVIFADEERFKKAINYLLSNAMKFTNTNGRITILAQEFLKEVEIVISDTGLGISEQKLPILFNKFTKVGKIGNNLPGTGFGLVTIKQIIDLHKGFIRVKSKINEGTSFIIRLPKYSFN